MAAFSVDRPAVARFPLGALKRGWRNVSNPLRNPKTDRLFDSDVTLEGWEDNYAGKPGRSFPGILARDGP